MRAFLRRAVRQAAAIFLVALLAAGLPVPANAQTAPSLPRLEFVDAELVPLTSNQAATGDGAAVFVQLTRPSDAASARGFASVRGVAIRSTHADGTAFDAGWTIDLLETRPGSGVFVGSFRVSPPAAQSGGTPRSPAPPTMTHPEFGKIFGDGVLRTEVGGRLQAQLGSLRAETRWQPASDALVAGPEPGTEIRGYGTRLDFRVQDKDLNLAPTATERHPVLLRAYSDSTPQGVPVPLVESDPTAAVPTAAVNSAVFRGSIVLADSPSSSEAGTLFVRPNERIWAVYHDRSDAQGRPTRVDVPAIGQPAWMFQPTTNGVLSLGPEHQYLADRLGAPDGGDGIYDQPIVLTITDREPSVGSNAADELPVTLRVTDPTREPFDVSLATLGPGVGLFQASLFLVRPVSEGGPTDAALLAHPPGPLWARVADGARIEATYEDLDDQGARVTRVATTRVHHLADATLQLGPSPTTGLLVGDRDRHVLLLRDPDANLDPSAPDRVVTQVRSRLDATGIQVELTEDSDNSGVFVGSIAFSTAPSTTGRLGVRDGDIVVAEYRDLHTAGGVETLVRSNLVSWRAAAPAQVAFDASTYARQAPASACDWNATARIIVRDADADDPTRVDAVTVTFREAGGTSTTLVANETGPNTAVFIAEVLFGRTGTTCPSSPSRFQPALAPGVDPVTRVGNVRSLEAVYFDEAAENGFASEVFARATWAESGSLARFEDRWDAGAKPATLLYHDVAADAEAFAPTPATAGTKTVFAFYSSQAPTGVYASTDRCPDTLRALDFVEQPLGSGRWVSNVTVTTDIAVTGNPCVPPAFAESGTRLRIHDVAGRSVTDAVRIGGLPASQTVAPLVVRGTTAWNLRLAGAGIESIGAAPLAIGDRQGVGIELVAPGLNRDSGRADTAAVSASSLGAANSNTISLTVLETGPDTDRFVSTIGVRDDAGRGGAFVTATDPEASSATTLRTAPHRRICFWDSSNGAGVTNNPDVYANNDTYEPIYLKAGTACGPVAAGDVRLTPSGGILTISSTGGGGPSSTTSAAYDYYAGGAVVRAHDLDVGKATIDTWSEHYNGTGRVVPNPTGSRFAFIDSDADLAWDVLEPVYVDLDGSGSVTVNDLRVSDNILDGGDGFLPAFSRVMVGQPDCVGLGTAATSCGPSKALRALEMGRLAYVDVDQNSQFDERDALFLDRSPGTVADRVAAAGDLRVTGLGDVAGTTLSVSVPQLPTTPSLGLATKATLPATIIAYADARPGTIGSVRWIPARAATISGLPGYGTETRPQLIIQDDVAAEYRDDVRLVSNGAAAFQPPERPRPDTVLVFATSTERVPQDQVGAAPSPDAYVVRARGRAAQPIADANGDGRLTCGDLEISAGAVCTSTTTDLLNGIVRYQCVSSTCAFQLRYTYRVMTLGAFDEPCSVCDVYRATVAPDGKITFGAPVPDGQSLRLHYRPAFIRLPVSSTQGASTITTPFHLVPDATGALSYIGDIPVTSNGGSGLQVRPGPGARDELRVHYADRRTPADAVRATDPVLLGATGITTWIASELGTIRFGSRGEIDDVTGTVNGPLVPIQIRDPDADLSDQPDILSVHVRNLREPRDVATVLARETGARTGIFHATVPVVETPCSPTCPRSDGAIHIPTGDGVLVVSYADPFGSNGSPATVSVAVAWRTAQSAEVVVGSTSLRVDAAGDLIPGPESLLLRGSEAGLYVAVADSDRNVNSFAIETVTVRVSTADDPSGEVIRLVETGLATGTFLSPGIRFEGAPTPNNGRVYARDGATDGQKVRILYEDPLNEDGVNEFVEPDTLVRWKRTFDGVVSFDRSFYVGTKADSATGTIRYGGVLVEDGDLNLDPSIVDRPTVRVAVGRASPEGRLDPARIVQLRMFETRADSGVFMGRFSFVTNTADAPVVEGDITSGQGQTAQVPMSAAGTAGRIRAEYVDAEDSRGLPVGADVTYAASAQWFAAGVGVLRFDQGGYNDYQDSVAVTLIDRDLDVTAQPDTVTIKVRTNFESTALPVSITEDGNRSGVFVGVLGLDPSGSPPGKIHVGESDMLVASYDDAFPFATRTASARIGIGEHASASTTVRTTPSTPTGERGAFLEPITVNLTANKLVERIHYRLGASGANQTYTEAIHLGEGVHTLYYWSIDPFGNIEPERERTFVVDLTNPTEPIVGLAAKAMPGGFASISWKPVDGTGDELASFDYLVFRDEDFARPIGNTTNTTFLDTTLAGDGPHAYRVLARDFAGRRGPLSAPVSVTVDALPPSVTQLQLRPLVIDLRAPPANVEVTATASDARLANVTVVLLRSDETVLSAAPMQRLVGSSFRGIVNITNLTQPCLCIVRVEATDSAGNNGTAERRLLVNGPDTTPPTVRWPTTADPAVARGTPVDVVVSDNVLLTSIRYLVDGQRDNTVTILEDSDRVAFKVATGSLSVGNHTLTVIAADNAVDDMRRPKANVQTRHLSFSVLANGNVTLLPGEASGYVLPTEAHRRPDGLIQVGWLVPNDESAPVWLGFQVWRSSSPYRLLANVSDAQARHFVDTTAVEGTRYRYLVTGFTAESGLFTSLDQVPGYSESAGTQLEASVGEDKPAWPAWLWVVVSSGALFLVGAVVAIVLSSRAGASAKAQPTPIAAGRKPTATRRSTASSRANAARSGVARPGPRSSSPASRRLTPPRPTPAPIQTPIPEEPTPESGEVEPEPAPAEPAPDLSQPLHEPENAYDALPTEQIAADVAPEQSAWSEQGPVATPQAGDGPGYVPALTIQCPRCGTTFGTDDTPPIKVKCPGCGKKGKIR